MNGKARLAMIADAAVAALTGVVQEGEYKRRLLAAHGVTKSLARAILNVDDFDDLISDLRQVLWVYSIPKPPVRDEAPTAETPAVSMADIVSSPRLGGES